MLKRIPSIVDSFTEKVEELPWLVRIYVYNVAVVAVLILAFWTLIFLLAKPMLSILAILTYKMWPSFKSKFTGRYK